MLQVTNFAKNKDILVIEPCFNLPEPIDIPYYGREVVPSDNHLSPVVIYMPTTFPYETTQFVPWKYEIIDVEKVYEECEGEKGLKYMDENVTNIAGMS